MDVISLIFTLLSYLSGSCFHNISTAYNFITMNGVYIFKLTRIIFSPCLWEFRLFLEVSFKPISFHPISIVPSEWRYVFFAFWSQYSTPSHALTSTLSVFVYTGIVPKARPPEFLSISRCAFSLPMTFRECIAAWSFWRHAISTTPKTWGRFCRIRFRVLHGLSEHHDTDHIRRCVGEALGTIILGVILAS